MIKYFIAAVGDNYVASSKMMMMTFLWLTILNIFIDPFFYFLRPRYGSNEPFLWMEESIFQLNGRKYI